VDLVITFLVKRYHIDYIKEVIYNISVGVMLIRILRYFAFHSKGFKYELV